MGQIGNYSISMKALILVIVLASILLSFFNWSIYAYNSEKLLSDMKGLEALYDKDNNISKEDYVLKAKVRQICWEENSKKWMFKLIIDLLVLVLVIYINFRKKVDDQNNNQ